MKQGFSSTSNREASTCDEYIDDMKDGGCTVAKVIGIESSMAPKLISELNKQHAGKFEWKEWDEDVDVEQVYYSSKVIAFLFLRTVADAVFGLGDFFDMTAAGFHNAVVYVDALQGRRPQLIGYLKGAMKYSTLDERESDNQHVRKQLIDQIKLKHPE